MAEDAPVAETADPDIPFHPLEQELVIDFRSCSEIKSRMIQTQVG